MSDSVQPGYVRARGRGLRASNGWGRDYDGPILSSLLTIVDVPVSYQIPISVSIGTNSSCLDTLCFSKRMFVITRLARRSGCSETADADLIFGT